VETRNIDFIITEPPKTNFLVLVKADASFQILVQKISFKTYSDRHLNLAKAYNDLSPACRCL